MEKLVNKAQEVRKLYDKLNASQGHKKWELSEYIQGLVGDIGDLTKLVMAHNGFRNQKDQHIKLEHELSDCLWSLLIICDQLNINLEKAYFQNMEQLITKLKNNL